MTENNILKITDTSIQRILMNHLSKNNNNAKVAFSPEGLVEMNNTIQDLNGGKPHNPIYKVRISEALGQKFTLGNKANNSSKYVVTAEGTNLFFAIYQDSKGARIFETIPLNVVIARLKQKRQAVPPVDSKGNKLLFWLSPNDLVYVPSREEIDNPHLVNTTNIKTNQIYKMVNCSERRAFFISTNVAKPILNKIEFTSRNKLENTTTGESFKVICWKLTVNRLGEITDITK